MQTKKQRKQLAPRRDMLATRMKGEKSPSLEATSRILTKIGLGPNIPDESRKVNNTGDSFLVEGNIFVAAGNNSASIHFPFVTQIF